MSAAVPESRLVAAGRVRRRKTKNRLMEVLALVASALAVGLLVLMVGSVFIKALPGLSLDLFTKNQAIFGESGGGIANAFVGSIIIVAIAAAMALPVGVLIAIYVSEFARPRVALIVRSSLDVLNGVPSIVIGIFVYSLLVLRFKQSAFVASIALAIIGLPLISRSAQEVLKLVPNSLREASQALGVSKWRTVLRVVLPTTLGGIATGTTLAIARMAGETAPILFTSTLFTNTVTWDPHHPVATVPFVIFTYSEAPDQNLHQQAWAAAFVLIMFVLIISLSARYLLHRSARKLSGKGGGPDTKRKALETEAAVDTVIAGGPGV
jgi:phosphate transport system permease protein